MSNPLHLGELIRENRDEVGWNMTVTTARPGCKRGTLSCLLNGKTGVSKYMALEDIGWGTAGHWMRMLVSCNLAQVRWDRVSGKGKDEAATGSLLYYFSCNPSRQYLSPARAVGNILFPMTFDPSLPCMDSERFCDGVI